MAAEGMHCRAGPQIRRALALRVRLTVRRDFNRVIQNGHCVPGRCGFFEV